MARDRLQAFQIPGYVVEYQFGVCQSTYKAHYSLSASNLIYVEYLDRQQKYILMNNST